MRPTAARSSRAVAVSPVAANCSTTPSIAAMTSRASWGRGTAGSRWRAAPRPRWSRHAPVERRCGGVPAPGGHPYRRGCRHPVHRRRRGCAATHWSMPSSRSATGHRQLTP
jgi:hypothetical protein